MALDYGYTIRIQSNGTSDPTKTPTNQWQRKLSGQSNFVDIAGEKGTTYLVNRADQSGEIRLKQDFSGSVAYSNALTVTSSSPPPPDIDSVTWERIPGTPSGDFVSLKHSKDYSTLIALETKYWENKSGNNLFWYSQDGGETWNKQTLSSASLSAQWAIEGPDSKTWYIQNLGRAPSGQTNHMFVSKITNLTSLTPTINYPSLNDSTQDSLAYINGALYANTSQSATNNDSDRRHGTAKLFKSTNDGSTWTEMYHFPETDWTNQINNAAYNGDSMTYIDGWYYLVGTSHDYRQFGGKVYFMLCKAQNPSGPWTKAMRWSESINRWNYDCPGVQKMQGEIHTVQAADWLYTTSNPVTTMTKKARDDRNYYHGFNYSKDKTITFTITMTSSSDGVLYTSKPSKGWENVSGSGAAGKKHAVVEGNGRWILATSNGLWRSKN